MSTQSTIRTLRLLSPFLLLPAGAAAQDAPLQRLQAEDRAAGDLFACALSLSGGTLLAGSLLDDDRGPDSGSAYVFDLGRAGWSQSAKLIGADTAAGDRFGFSVVLDGDRALVGAPLSGAGGAAYRFDRVGGAWRQTARFAGAEAGADAGAAVALLADRWALVGAPLADAGGRTDAGAVLAFPLPGGGPLRLEAATPRARAGLGWALAGAGDLLAAGAPWADAPFTGAGAVALFAAGAEGFRPLAEVTAPDAAPFQSFGYAVGLGGDLLVVGAPRDATRGPSAGAIYLFRVRDGAASLEAKIPGSVAGDQYGVSVAVRADGRGFAVGARGGATAAGIHAGYVDVFVRSEGLWIGERRIQPASAAAGDEVGIDVSLSGDGIAVGAYKDDGGGTDAGAAYVSVPAADLALAKRLEVPAPGARPPAPGEEVVFVVEVENRGPSDAFGARVVDDPPAGLTAVTWTCAAEGGARCTPAGSGAIDERVDLPAGSRVTYRLAGIVAQGVTGTLVNRAAVTPPAGLLDPDPDNGADEAAVPVASPASDLFFAVRFLSGVVAVPGEGSVHEVVIGNLGPSDAPPLTFAGGGLGPAFVAPTWTCTGEAGAGCVPATGTGPIAGTVTLPAGSRVVYRVEATVAPGARGELVLAGGLGPLPGLDPDPANNSDREATPLEPRTDLSAGLSPPVVPSLPAVAALRPRQEGGELRLRPGETALFEARFANAGPSDALGARVRATLPAGLDGAGWTCAPAGGAACAPAGAGVLDDRPDLPVGSEVVYTFAAVALPGYLGPRPVAVSVDPAGAFEDPRPSDNRAETPGPVLLPDGSFAATLEAQGGFAEGEVTTYELLVANGLGVAVADAPGDEALLPIPPELEPVAVTASSGAARVDSPALVAWSGGFAAEEVVTISIRARIREGTRGSEVAAQADLTLIEAQLLSAPPGVLEPAPTLFVVLALVEIPTASAWGLALFALLLAAGALGFLGRSS